MFPSTLTILSLLTNLVSSAVIKPHDGDTATGSWTPIAPIPIHPRQEHSAVTLSPDTIYIIGGLYQAPDGNFPTVTTVQKYSPSTNTWSLVASLPIPLNHPNCAVVQGKIYVLGGLTTVPHDPTFWNASGECFSYDSRLDMWKKIGELPKGRWVGSAAVGVSGSTVYLAGGLAYTNLTDDQEGTVSIFTAYDITTRHFTILPDLPEPRDHAGVGLIDEKLYVLGGRAYGHNNVKSTVFSYNIKRNCWSEKLATMPTARGGCSSGVIGTQIFTVGGEGDKETDSGVFPHNEAYDTRTNTWKTYAPMDLPRHGTAGVAIENRIYIPGGGLHTGGLPTNYSSYFQLEHP
ncbi:putative kelch domain-containing protein 8B [Tricladium varicosporioides]|nr:putative kelch domain-containing protein 8B [Hymenoscyphus varicosporioides]